MYFKYGDECIDDKDKVGKLLFYSLIITPILILNNQMEML